METLDLDAIPTPDQEPDAHFRLVVDAINRRRSRTAERDNEAWQLREMDRRIEADRQMQSDVRRAEADYLGQGR